MKKKIIWFWGFEEGALLCNGWDIRVCGATVILKDLKPGTKFLGLA